MPGKLSCAFAFVVMFTVLSTAQAGIILNGSGQAVEVTNVLVAGTYYDVTFGVGSYNTVFGSGPTPVPLPTFEGMQLNALQALTGIRSQLNAASVSLVADALGVTANSIIVPHMHSATTFNGEWTGNGVPLPWGAGSLGGVRSGSTFGPSIRFSFALFTPAAAEVPEPASLTLLAIGCCGLCGLRLRRKLQTSA